MADETIKKTLVVVLAVSSYYVWLGSHIFLNLSVLAVVIYLLSGYKRRRHLRMVWRDVRSLVKLIHVATVLGKAEKNEKTVPKIFKKVCEKFPDKVMYNFEDESWTFRKVDEFSNQVANFFLSRGVCEGDNVALFMETRMEYVPFWLGLQKIGVAVSLINNNLTENLLEHNLKAVSIKAIIYGPEVATAIAGVSSSLRGVSLYVYGDDSGEKLEGFEKPIDLKISLKNASTKAPPTPGTKHNDTALYVFTSGTTGLPKAAVISHSRFIAMTIASNLYMRMRGDDVLYNPLPLYHTNGGVIAVGQALLMGLTVSLRKKFSVSCFWSDCCRYNCTVFMYIGELCRYLLAAPPRPEDRRHKVRLMFGNGLRPLVWADFTKRFAIRRVAEFYGSSEGIGSLMNTEGRVGAVGHIPLLWPKLMPIFLVKIDIETETPLRNEKGRCIRVTEPGVPGMHISKIMNQVGQDFVGYADRTASKKKIIENVFQDGDKYYVSGDVFTMDDEQFLYFQDRTGDTFRWRGENVSTTEVEQVISDILVLKDAAVYGVKIFGLEGKAGMAAIAAEDGDVNLDHLNQEMSKRLPKYAKPLFLRILQKIQLTDTFKMKKKQLKDEGYNPNVVSDKLYFYEAQHGKYLELTKVVYEKIKQGTIVF